VAVDVPVGTEFTYRYMRDGGGGVESKVFDFGIAKETCWYADAIDDTWAA
jgi:hypothetical protein